MPGAAAWECAEHLGEIGRAIRRTARRFSVELCKECVEDLEQECLIRLWQKGLPDGDGRRPYMRTIAANITIDHLRRRGAEKRGQNRTESLSEHIAAPDPTPTPEHALIAAEELGRRLEECRGLLQARAWVVFCLVYVQGLGRGEVAEQLGIARGSVDSIVHRLRRRLREHGVAVAGGRR